MNLFVSLKSIPYLIEILKKKDIIFSSARHPIPPVQLWRSIGPEWKTTDAQSFYESENFCYDTVILAIIM